MKIKACIPKFSNIDLFAALNLTLFVMMCIVVYYDRFISFRGKVNIHEFYIYATVIIALIIYSWQRFRLFKIPTYLLMMVELGILLHFSGGFVEIGDHRLYDVRLFHIRYDKFVHFYNSMAAMAVILTLVRRYGLNLGLLCYPIAVLSVLGLGAIVEIIEFFVTLTVPHNGVGTYNNNMLDLVANFIGSLSAAAFDYRFMRQKWLKSKQATPR